MNKEKKTKPFQNALGEFTYLRTYSQYNESGKERWDETVSRVGNYFLKRIPNLKKSRLEEIMSYVTRGEVMPSMRLMQNAGLLCERFEESAYNCSFLKINRIESLSEILFLNMLGVGVGYSIHESVIDELPKVSEAKNTGQDIVVEDSTEGWVLAYRKILLNLWDGLGCNLKLDKVRKKGSPIKGRGVSAGRETFLDIFNFTRDVVRSAEGRKLRAVELFDIISYFSYKMSNSGPRRSATISLSSLSDEEMAKAKTGKFYLEYPHRTVCNNSTTYLEQPKEQDFLREWTSLREGMTGERGIFNALNFSSWPKRRKKVEPLDRGTNPCGEIDLIDCQFCNLSEVILRRSDDEQSLLKKIEVASELGTWQSALTNFREDILTSSWRLNSERERLLGVSLTGWADCPLLRNNPDLLTRLRQRAVDVNLRVAAEIGVNASSAITCVKPSGTVSTVFNCSPGIHARFSKYYLRRIRLNHSDPMTKVIEDSGFPVHRDPFNAEQVYLEFGVESPSESITYDSLSCEDQLEVWKQFKLFYTEHNPSFTCLIAKDEWEQASSWIWSNWNLIGGISFLQKDDHIYEAAPYEKIDEERYNVLRLQEKLLPWCKLYNLRVEGVTSGCDKSLV